MQCSLCRRYENHDDWEQERFGGNHNLTIIFVDYICAISEIKMAYRNSFFQSGNLE